MSLSNLQLLTILAAALATSSLFPATLSAQKAPPPPPPSPRGHGGPAVNETPLNVPGSTEIVGEVWVDNWFRLHSNGEMLIEDSVSIRTERSFNAERFTFKADLPLTLAFEFRDFMENETGLEYIGKRKQQMGDGGAIAQFKDLATGKLLAVTSDTWRCKVAQQAPKSPSCAKERNPVVDTGACAQSVTPISANWTAPDFDDSRWPNASAYSVRAVRPKDGYDQISWDRTARIIWSGDLERDNIVLCRLTISK